MANYFTHFSCLLDVGTSENAARALDLYNALSAENAATRFLRKTLPKTRLRKVSSCLSSPNMAAPNSGYATIPLAILSM